jgi:hypothetical protein
VYRKNPPRWERLGIGVTDQHEAEKEAYAQVGKGEIDHARVEEVQRILVYDIRSSDIPTIIPPGAWDDEKRDPRD